ncbi:hypothetical protein YC2023_050490 [Brassica napus]
MMPVTVNVNRFATHMPNTSPALTYAACYNTSWILSPEQCASCCSSPVICNQKLYQIHGAITVASVAASVATPPSTDSSLKPYSVHLPDCNKSEMFSGRAPSFTAFARNFNYKTYA